LISLESLIGLPSYEITGIENEAGTVTVEARHTGQQSCPQCKGQRLRNKGVIERVVRHVSWSAKRVFMRLKGHLWHCRDCGRSFRERFTGVLPGQHATEAFRGKVFQDHWDGISRSRLARREAISGATVERHFQHFLARFMAEISSPRCPQILGIDEHFFSRKHGYATTLCDLKNHSVYDVVLGRSEASLEVYFNRLEGKDEVRIVCMDLASCYRALVRKHFPNAVIVADRFHVIRLVNQHFAAFWRQLDPVGAKNRGLVSLMRRHACNLSSAQRLKLEMYLAEQPALYTIYRFKQRLCHLLLNKHRTAKQCRKLAPRLLRSIHQLRECGLAPLETLGDTLHSWSEEIARMWRYTRSNAITEGFHTKMEVLQRQAYGFKNFDNYRMRVRVLCSSNG
jgi:transposase